MRYKPFSDINVRKALNYGTDKSAINAGVYGGVGEVANDMLPKTRYNQSYKNVPAYTFDLAKAKQLMQKSGFPKGFSTTMIYPSGSAIHQSLGTILQTQWRELGVKLNVTPVDTNAILTQYLKGKFEVAVPLVQFTSDVPVPDENATAIYTNAKTSTFQGMGEGWHVPDDLVKATATAAALTQDAKRARAWGEVQKLAMSYAPWVTLFNLPAVTLFRDPVRSFVTSIDGWWILKEAWLKR